VVVVNSCVGVTVLSCSKLSCEPLILPGYKEGVVIQPGLFKGTYGDHGLELVLLTYEDDDSKAVITKITVCNGVLLYLLPMQCLHYSVHIFFVLTR